MSRQTLLRDVSEWLIDQALAEPDIVEMFNQTCARLYALGVPISRARVTWPTLHPLFQAETILWSRNGDTEFEQFRHQDEASEEWRRSPMSYMLENGLGELRRNLTGPNKLIDFPILEDLLEQGFTDYLLVATPFENPHRNVTASRGLIVSWACEREEGFSEDDIAALKRIQRQFAVACKMAIQRRIAHNVTETYLGRHAGGRVLEGAIKLGDREQVQAVVWYCDMRDSTKLADTMPEEELLELLNDYFACTAGPATRFGGEVLDFIGDAVLAIFPFETDEDRDRAIRRATAALDESEKLARETNERRKAEGKSPFRFGIGMTVGDVVYGNIGVADRLAFTVVGPVVNKVERIETLTKAIDTFALVSEDIASLDPARWTSTGTHRLDGFAHDCLLFARAAKDQTAPEVTRKDEKASVKALN